MKEIVFLVLYPKPSAADISALSRVTQEKLGDNGDNGDNETSFQRLPARVSPSSCSQSRREYPFSYHLRNQMGLNFTVFAESCIVGVLFPVLGLDHDRGHNPEGWAGQEGKVCPSAIMFGLFD